MENGNASQMDTQIDSQFDANPIPSRKQLDVLPAVPTELKPNDMYYSMKRPDRGYAFIFNHETYDEIDGKNLERRHGTSQDVDRLNHSLSNLGFQVDIKNNPSYDEIMSYIYRVSKDRDLEQHDCLAVFVLSHGNENEKIYARDKAYNVRDIVQPFVGKNCLQLANKPKLFFIQACKGLIAQSKVNLRTITDGLKANSSKTGTSVYSIPADSDVLISYATLEGYMALRDPKWGTPYIMALCDEFDKNGTTLDLLSMLIRVHHRLATSTFMLEGTTQLIKVQPSFTCYLNRFIRFESPTFSKAITQ